ncbi:MAG: DUF805 domain-containing protein [Hellea sp.]|nr:DUF805 domain-containing protein [Hellea sp.]
MLNTYLSPKGRMNSNDFKKAAYILILIGLFYRVFLWLLPPSVIQIILMLMSFLILYSWLAIWIKRYHNAGKSGWYSLLPIITLMFLNSLSERILIINFDAGYVAFREEMMALSKNPSGDISAFFEIMDKSLQPFPSVILSSLVASLVVVIMFNSYIISSDDHENQYGPVA